ncbi:MAG: inorganic phosphate transporter [Aigarchaeota archaeon]|nr:inorganic phosphate transporter [Aigarchaeota archaeon]MDH5703818.1 inorganic phosphate transporter [Aigarchaeota archaeon]
MSLTFLALGIGLALSFYMAWTLGANDAATPAGCPVGAGVISMKKALIVFAVFSMVGALAQGFMNITTIGRGLVPQIDLVGAISVVLAACIWVTLCTWKGLEISNTHSVVGGIIGYGLIVQGSVEVRLLSGIVAAWIASPLLSAALAVLVYMVLKRILRRSIDENKVQRMISLLLIGSLCFSAYSFGANDVGNATGVYVTVAQRFGNMPDYITMVLLAAFGALGIAIGGLTWGSKVVATVAYRIVRLDPLSALSAELATAFIIFIFVTLPYTLIGYGLPVSTSIASVGSIIGVGFAKDRSSVNKGTIGRLVATWIATPFATSVLSMISYSALSRFASPL